MSTALAILVGYFVGTAVTFTVTLIGFLLSDTQPDPEFDLWADFERTERESA